MLEGLERPIIKHQHALMVLASFITTMAFQAGITPIGICGGFKKKYIYIYIYVYIYLTEDDSMWRSLKERKKIKRKKR